MIELAKTTRDWERIGRMAPLMIQSKNLSEEDLKNNQKIVESLRERYRYEPCETPSVSE